MSRKRRINRLYETDVGQHLALSLAAHLACTQLVRAPFGPRGRATADILDGLGTALSRTTRLYAFDRGGDPRELAHEEVAGAKARRGATILILADGRTLSGVSIKRNDLRQAIAILKTLGIPELGISSAADQAVREPAIAPAARLEKLRAQLAEIEALLDVPLLAPHMALAQTLAIAMARHAPAGPVPNRAMQLITALQAAGNDTSSASVAAALALLRTAVDAQYERERHASSIAV